MPVGQKRKALTDDEIISLIRLEAEKARAYQDAQILSDRKDALQRYNADPYGDEVDGQSAVVTTEVRDTIESILPQLVKIFLGTDRIVEFQPETAADEEGAEQATDTVSYVLQHDNQGFMLLYTMFKDAMLNKNSVVKAYWDDTVSVKEEEYHCLMDVELHALLADDEIEPLELSKYEEMIPPGIDAAGFALPPQPVTLYDVKVKRTSTKGRAKLDCLPAEEFLIAGNSATIQSSRFVAHEPQMTVSDMIEMGFKREDIWPLVGEDTTSELTDRIERFREDGGTFADSDAVQDAMANVKYSEVYMLIDTDGDGIAERWQFKCCGSNYKLLSKEKWDAPWPFESITPVPMPHKFFGKSVADLVKDIQRIKTTLTRALLNNLYQINNARTAVQENMVDLDDLLTVRPGGIVRTKAPPQTVMQQLPPSTIVGEMVPTLQYIDSVHENRTGVTKYNQGLDANSLNKTASGISQIMSAAQERILLIARIFAETGVSGIFRQVLRLLVRYQDKPRTIKLRGKWVAVDPSRWSEEMATTVDVALGTQNAQVMTAMLMQILGIQEKLMAVQSPLATWDNVYKTLAKLVETVGLKNVQSFFTDPSTVQQPQAQQPSPEAQLAQAQVQSEALKSKTALGVQQQKSADEAHKIMAQLAAKRMEVQSKEKMNAQNIAADFVSQAFGAFDKRAQPGDAPAEPAGGRQPRRIRIVRDPATREMQFLEEVFKDATEQTPLVEPMQ